MVVPNLKVFFDLERLQAALRLPRSTILIAQDAGSRGAIGFADTRSVPLDASSCAHTLEHGLCVGIACGKGDLSENHNQGHCH